jgi:hypothetical protein
MEAAGGRVRAGLLSLPTVDATALPQLRRLLDESLELWRGYGDLALQARSSWIQLAAGQNLDECLTRRAAELRKEVAGDCAQTAVNET